MVAKVGIIIWDELIVALTFACGRLMRAVVCSLPHVVHEDVHIAEKPATEMETADRTETSYCEIFLSFAISTIKSGRL